MVLINFTRGLLRSRALLPKCTGAQNRCGSSVTGTYGSSVTGSSVTVGKYKVMGLPEIKTRQMKRLERKQAWFSDPAVFPIIVVMGGAAALVVGVGISCIFYNPDVQIDPKRRNNIMRDWGI
eukprot:scaffold173655_cov103-Attheya_sp.AAC.1